MLPAGGIIMPLQSDDAMMTPSARTSRFRARCRPDAVRYDGRRGHRVACVRSLRVRDRVSAAPTGRAKNACLSLAPEAWLCGRIRLVDYGIIMRTDSRMTSPKLTLMQSIKRRSDGRQADQEKSTHSVVSSVPLCHSVSLSEDRAHSLRELRQVRSSRLNGDLLLLPTLRPLQPVSAHKLVE